MSNNATLVSIVHLHPAVMDALPNFCDSLDVCCSVVRTTRLWTERTTEETTVMPTTSCSASPRSSCRRRAFSTTSIEPKLTGIYIYSHYVLLTCSAIVSNGELSQKNSCRKDRRGKCAIASSQHNRNTGKKKKKLGYQRH